MRIARNDQDILLYPSMGNRHGLIAGATGTGKTVSLQVMAEQFSKNGVPVFLTDIKGDLSGISQTGKETEKIQARLSGMGIADFGFEGFPVTFWDIFGKLGHPVRTTISEMGPLLMARLLDLNDIQSATLQIVFKVADENGWLLLDIKDLRAMLEYAAENASDISSEYGLISTNTVAAIQRSLLNLEEQGALNLFSEPALNLLDLMRIDSTGKGVINILSAKKLILSPKVYSSFLLWMLSELFEELPEVGDEPKPRLVIFFDEAHLLFEDDSKFLIDKIEQVVRLIRSKGVGVFFVTQNPTDIPDKVLGQLGNRVQHAMRSFTPKDQKAIRAIAETFRINPDLNVEEVIGQLGVGEALVSFLNEDGVPGIVQRTLICPPRSQIGPISDDSIHSLVKLSDLYGRYEEEIDRESAYEILKKKTQSTDETAQATETASTASTTQSTESTTQAPKQDIHIHVDQGYPPPHRHGPPPPPPHHHRHGPHHPPPPHPHHHRHRPPTITEVIGSEIVRGIMGNLDRRHRKRW